eukprot:6178504-Pleurochrysis_carterae.AAC.1
MPIGDQLTVGDKVCVRAYVCAVCVRACVYAGSSNSWSVKQEQTRVGANPVCEHLAPDFTERESKSHVVRAARRQQVPE